MADVNGCHCRGQGYHSGVHIRQCGLPKLDTEHTMKKGKVISTAKDPDAESVYEMYYEFEEPVSKLAGHRILALNRGEKEKILTVKSGGAGGGNSAVSGEEDHPRGAIRIQPRY